ncbi:MAG: flagellar basal body rod protein FlgB [Deltaproteobacteria bacterium]|nr:flagellar basal body rod protein FlgB [Deltaproteobacteria bacterium]
MKLTGIFDQTTNFLKKALDLRVRKQQVISSNIANSDTPGYIPARMEFEGNLQNAIGGSGVKLAKTQSGHIGADDDLAAMGVTIVRESRGINIGDRNEVSVEEEMVHMAENQILYEATVQALNKKFGLLKYIVQDGR